MSKPSTWSKIELMALFSQAAGEPDQMAAPTQEGAGLRKSQQELEMKESRISNLWLKMLQFVVKEKKSRQKPTKISQIS